MAWRQLLHIDKRSHAKRSRGSVTEEACVTQRISTKEARQTDGWNCKMAPGMVAQVEGRNIGAGPQQKMRDWTISCISPPIRPEYQERTDGRRFGTCHYQTRASVTTAVVSLP